MKHEARRKKPSSPLPQESFNEPKKAAKKSAKDVSLNSSEPKAVKSVSVKSEPMPTAKNTKSKNAASKNKDISKAVKPTSSTIKKDSAVTKTEVVAPKSIAKAVKNSAQKAKPVAVAKQKNIPKANLPKAESKNVKLIQKTSAEKKSLKVSAVKTPKKIASVETKSVKIHLPESETETAKIAKAKIAKSPEPAEKNQRKQILISAKKNSAPRVSKPSAETVEKKSSIKIRNGRLVLPPLKKAELAATPINAAVETIESPAPKPRKRRIKAFGAGIFRGKKERYDFQIFPVDGEFEDAAAIFIISRRNLDKNKRAHHKMICIGQTISILDELKKHRKGKCFKQHQANAISILREENEQKRLKIEADLKSAHQIPCPHA